MFPPILNSFVTLSFFVNRTVFHLSFNCSLLFVFFAFSSLTCFHSSTAPFFALLLVYLLLLLFPSFAPYLLFLVRSTTSLSVSLSHRLSLLDSLVLFSPPCLPIALDPSARHGLASFLASTFSLAFLFFRCSILYRSRLASLVVVVLPLHLLFLLPSFHSSLSSFLSFILIVAILCL